MRRKRALSLIAGGAAGLALKPSIAWTSPSAAGRPVSMDLAGWKTWLVGLAEAGVPPPPPRGLDELGEVRARVAERSAIDDPWGPQGGVPVWSRLLLDRIRRRKTDPVKAARALALVHVAMADAALLAYRAKLVHAREAPAVIDGTLPAARDRDVLARSSYPSEHAAIGAAAATVCNYLYPAETIEVGCRAMSFRAAANLAGASRIASGACYPSDVEEGFRLGEMVGRQAVLRAQSDGSAGVWDPLVNPRRPVGERYWVSTPPSYVYPPLHPMAGQWDPWLLESGDQFLAPVPPALRGDFPSREFLAEAMEVKRTVSGLTREQRQIASFWADNPGQSFTPPGHWLVIALEELQRRELPAPHAARILAHLCAGLADAAIGCWNNKYTYWVLRPISAIRSMKGQPFHDPAFETVVVTPPFPAYTSGHATFSGCAATVLDHLLPGGKARGALGESLSYAEAAEQAAMSRLYGGIHYRSDNDEGLVCGRKVGGLVLERARSEDRGT